MMFCNNCGELGDDKICDSCGSRDVVDTADDPDGGGFPARTDFRDLEIADLEEDDSEAYEVDLDSEIL